MHKLFLHRPHCDWAPFTHDRQPIGRLDSQPVTQNYREAGAESGGFGGAWGHSSSALRLRALLGNPSAIPGGRFRYPCLRCTHSVASPATVCRKDQRSSTARGLKCGLRPANRDTAYCLVYPLSNVHDVHYVHGGLAGIGSWFGGLCNASGTRRRLSSRLNQHPFRVRYSILVAELRAFQTIVFPKPKKLGVDRFSSAGLSTPQKADSISPVPFRGFAGEGGQRSREAARIRWRDGLFVHKNHPAVLSPLLRPGFE
jgi:hypothetical protein